MCEYTNRNGVKFLIKSEKADVPSNADYYGYYFKVFDPSGGCHVHKAIVKKQLCDDEEKAGMWLHTTALDFLKGILDTYLNGKTLLMIPDSKNWWVI